MHKVISGGQIGVDIAALDAAKLLRVVTGGSISKGFRTKSGPRADYAGLYGLTELDSEDYPTRTRQNVADADATLVLYCKESAGVSLTRRYIRELQKPFFFVQFEHTPGFIRAVSFSCNETGQTESRRGLKIVPARYEIKQLPPMLARFGVVNFAGNSEADEGLCYQWFHSLFRAVLRLEGENE